VSHEYLGEHGIYAAAGNAEVLAAAILQLVIAPEHGRVLGQWLRARAVERFSWQDSGARLISIYDAVTSRHAVPAQVVPKIKSQTSNLK